MEGRGRNDETTLTGLARTFKEVVREEHSEGKDVGWKSFKDGIRIHSAGHAWAAAVAESANARPRAAQRRNPAWGGGADEQDEAVAALLQRRPPPAKEQPAVKMSLMALLADSGGYSDDDEDEEEDDGVGGHVGDEKVDGGDNGGGGKVTECCMCMVGHKGAAFIPCGHTFCRLCSREFSVSPGSCPLCSSFVLEILDVF